MKLKLDARAVEERAKLAAAAQLVVECAGAIDDDRLDDWPNFFSEDCVYRIETQESHARGWPIGLMHCEGRGMLRDRVLAIRHGNVFDPHRYRHVLSLPRFAPTTVTPAPLQESSGAKLAFGARVLTSFNVTRVMQSGEMSLFAVGTYDDVFVEVAGELLIHERVVLLDSRALDTLLVLPI
jgi:anthranilate 1,2-dioxygenase small subunit